MKIGIIGMGWVGSSVAISLLHKGVANELLLNDLREEVAEGEAMDLRHGSPFCPTAEINTAAIEDMRDCDAIVIAAGRGGNEGESRLELLKGNAEIVRNIGMKLTGASGLIVMVTNPVDVLTRLLVEAADLPPERVLGTGTMLETARIRHVLGREMNLAPPSIHAYVVGEHGDSQVPLWSSAQAGAKPLRQWDSWGAEKERKVGEEVRTAAYEIIQRKGATNHAIGLVTSHLLKWALRDERRILTVSRVQKGTLGIYDVAISLPAIVERDGAVQVIVPEMDDAEHAAVQHSAAVLSDAWKKLG